MNTPIPPYPEKPALRIPGVSDREMHWLRQLIIDAVKELRALQEPSTTEVRA